MAAHIDVDGYNLALEEGTGVATYARNLTAALAAMSVTTNVLYGHRMGAGAEAFMKENFRGGLRAKVITSGILRVG